MRKAFGLKGELFVAPVTNEPAEVFSAGRVVSVDGREWTVERSRPFKDGWLVKFTGVDDKTSADLWRGLTLRVPFAELSPPSGNEVYLHELTGMRVRDEPHGEIGAVAGWYELPQGLVLEVRGPQWRADVPFNDAFVTRVDREHRVIDLVLPDGLLEPAD